MGAASASAEQVLLPGCLPVLGDAASAEASEPDVWKVELIERLLELSPAGFERLAKRLLREAGFEAVETVGGPNDHGIDGTGIGC